MWLFITTQIFNPMHPNSQSTNEVVSKRYPVMLQKLELVLSLIFIFVSSTEKVILVPGLGNLARVIGIGMLAVWLASVIFDGRNLPIRPIHTVVIVFAPWNAVSIFWTVNGDAPLGRAMTWLQLAFHGSHIAIDFFEIPIAA